MGFIYFCIKFLRYALWSWTPYFLNRNYQLAGDEAGYLSTVFDLAGFAGVIFAGFASDKIFKGRRAFLSFIMLSVMAMSFFLMYVKGAESLLYFTVSMGIAGFMLYGPDSLISGVGAIDVTSKRGALAAAGIINGTGSIGPIFQEQLIGWLYERYNHELVPVFILLVLVAIGGAALTFFLWFKSRQGKVNL
jgi:sugar phosphate permease